eukprot:115526-Rhodomonas_salina.2
MSEQTDHDAADEREVKRTCGSADESDGPAREGQRSVRADTRGEDRPVHVQRVRERTGREQSGRERARASECVCVREREDRARDR